MKINSWEFVKLSDVINEVNNKANNHELNGMNFYIGFEHIDTDKLVINRYGNIKDGIGFNKLFKSGDILYGKIRPYLRKVAIAPFDGLCSGDILVFQTKDQNILLQSLLPYVITTEKFHNLAINTSIGTTMPRTKWKHLSCHKFRLPPLDEQQRIVALFQSIDKSILLTEQQGNNLKQLWLKLLNIFVSDKPKFGDLLCGEELNEYQYKDFSEKIVRKIDPIALGIERRIGGEDFSSSELKLRSWGIVGKDYLGPAFYQHVLPRDILYVSRNAHLRKVAFADFEGVCSNTTFVIRAKETIILQDLLKHIMLSEKFSQYAMSVSKGSTNPYLNWKDLNNFTVKLPELDKQRKIADLLDEVLLARETVLEQKRNLQILKQKLLNDILG